MQDERTACDGYHDHRSFFVCFHIARLTRIMGVVVVLCVVSTHLFRPVPVAIHLVVLIGSEQADKEREDLDAQLVSIKLKMMRERRNAAAADTAPKRALADANAERATGSNTAAKRSKRQTAAAPGAASASRAEKENVPKEGTAGMNRGSGRNT